MDGWVDGWLGGWIEGWMDRWMDGWLDGWMVGWMGGWMDGWFVGWVDGLMDCRLADLRLPKSLKDVLLVFHTFLSWRTSGRLNPQRTSYLCSIRFSVPFATLRLSILYDIRFVIMGVSVAGIKAIRIENNARDIEGICGCQPGWCESRD